MPSVVLCGSLTLWAVCPGVAAGLPTAPVVAEPEGFWMGGANAPVPATLHGAMVVHLKVLETLKNTAVVIDVSNRPRRPPTLAPGAPWLPVAHQGIPGALWFAGMGEGAISPNLAAGYRLMLARAAGSSAFDRPFIFYCHSACWLSWNAAKRALELGYRKVYWFADGIEGWSAAGKTTVVLEPAPLPPSLAVLDLELSGDLGGPEMDAEHHARLRTQSTRLRDGLARTELYVMLPIDSAQEHIDRLKSQQAYLYDCNGCDLDVGRELHADLVLVAWVDRVSGLILTLTYELHEVKTGQIAARKSYDFRGDNDNAWNHAVDYMVRDMKSRGAPALAVGED